MAERRILAQVQDDLVRIATAGSHGAVKARTAQVTFRLAAEAFELGKAEAEARYCPSLAKARSAYLDLFLSNRDLVDDIRYLEPELWRRLCDAILGEQGG